MIKSLIVNDPEDSCMSQVRLSSRRHRGSRSLARDSAGGAGTGPSSWCGGMECVWLSETRSRHTSQDGCVQHLPDDAMQSLPDDVTQSLPFDVIQNIMEMLHADGDLCSLLAVRSVGTIMARAARSELAQFTSDERAAAVIAGALPTLLRSTAERQAAQALVRNKLTHDVTVSLLQYANRSIELVRAGSRLGLGWKLNEWHPDHDPHDDNAFELIGFQTIPATEAVHRLSGEPVLDWYTEQWPLRPLKRRHLPCVLAGPPRYMTLAGSKRDQKSVRHIPMELCRLVSSPTCDYTCSEDVPGGAELVSALVLVLEDGC